MPPRNRRFVPSATKPVGHVGKRTRFRFDSNCTVGRDRTSARAPPTGAARRLFVYRCNNNNTVATVRTDAVARSGGADARSRHSTATCLLVGTAVQCSIHPPTHPRTHAQTLVCAHTRAHALARVCAHTDRYGRGTHRYGSGVRICSPLSPPAGASATADGISESLRTDESSAAAGSASRSCITCACAFACIDSHARACVLACARAACVRVCYAWACAWTTCIGTSVPTGRHSVGWAGLAGYRRSSRCVCACVRSFVNAHVRLRERVSNVRACAGTGRRDQNLARLGHTVFVDDEQVSVRLRVGQRLLSQSRARPTI